MFVGQHTSIVGLDETLLVCCSLLMLLVLHSFNSYILVFDPFQVNVSKSGRKLDLCLACEWTADSTAHLLKKCSPHELMLGQSVFEFYVVIQCLVSGVICECVCMSVSTCI